MRDNLPRDCALAQDLMPLEMDGLCSKEGSAFIREHLRECAACRQAYESMCAENGLRAAKRNEDTKASLHALRHFFRLRTARSTVIAVAGLLACALVCYGVYVGLWGDTSRPLDLSRYEVSLWRTPEDFVFTHVTYAGTNRGYLGGTSISGHSTEEGGYEISYTVSSSLIPRRLQAENEACTVFYSPYYYLHDGVLYEARYCHDATSYWLCLQTPVSVIYQGSGNTRRPVYEAGDDIPLCEDADLPAGFYDCLHADAQPQPAFPRDENCIDVPLPG